jgi:16S rRNA C1402 (ribose-2'-O) methylase RsmI
MSNPKVSIEDVLAAAREAGVPAELIKVMEKDLLKAAQEEKNARVPKSKSKTQFVVLIDDPENKLEGQPLLGWVAQIEDEAPQMALVDRVKAAARAFNESRKGRKRPVKNIRETFMSVPRKFFKDGIEGHKTLPKTKEPVALIPVTGELT